MPIISNSNKVRIIALYIQFREGVPDEDRRRLYQHARLSLPEQDAVNALVHLGVRISRVSTCGGVVAYTNLSGVDTGPCRQGHKEETQAETVQ